MRTAYCKALFDIMADNQQVFALTADIGFRNFDKIINDFPDRFINVGVAEANMVGIAAGLALSGKIPFIFTIAPFVTMRCLEQIRIDLCYQKLPVKIIGAGGGFVYGPQGTTHHAIEEIGMLRTIPEMTVIAPADPVQTEKAVHATMNINSPVYIRIGRNNEPVIYNYKQIFNIGKADILQEGKDVSILTYGALVKNSIDAAAILNKSGISTGVVNMHTIKPIDINCVLECAKNTSTIVTIEEHNIIGGLGSAVAEILSENNHRKILFKRIGINDKFIRMNAEYKQLQTEFFLDSDGIASLIKNLIIKDS